MNRILEQLNFYDIFGYLVPGAVALGAALVGVVALYPDVGIDFTSPSLWSASGFVVMSYLVGHVVQALAKQLEPSLKRWRWGGSWPSELYLQRDTPESRPAFVDSLLCILRDDFDLGPEPHPADAFAICYSYVIQHGIRRRVEVFLGFLGLSRGMIVASITAAALLGSASGVHFATGGGHAAWLSLAAALVCLAAVPVFCYRFFTFSERFAEAVYRDFFVAVKSAE